VECWNNEIQEEWNIVLIILEHTLAAQSQWPSRVSFPQSFQKPMSCLIKGFDTADPEVIRPSVTLMIP
jgi:hypothetical protein